MNNKSEGMHMSPKAKGKLSKEEREGRLKAKEKRIQIMEALYGLGMSVQEIAELLGWSKATIDAEVAIARNAGKFFARPVGDRAVIEAVMRKRVELERNESDLEEVERVVKMTIDKWLSIYTVLGTTCVIADKLVRPCAEQREDEPYVRLLTKLLGLEASGLEEPAGFWSSYLRNTASRIIDHDGYERVLSVQEDAIHAYTEAVRDHFALPFPHEGVRIIEGCLAFLSEREQIVIRLRCGIGQEAETQAQISKRLGGISNSAVHQIEAKAYRKLRALKHGRALMAELQMTVGQYLEHIKKLRARNDEFAARVKELENELNERADANTWHLGYQGKDILVKMSDLMTPVDDLDWSMTKYPRHLKDAGILCLGDLVQKTAKDVLDIWTFGKKSLIEIQEVLFERGLFLGMVLPEPILTAFSRERARRFNQ